MNNLIIQAAKRFANRIAIVDHFPTVHNNKTITYQELFRQSTIAKEHLKKLGLKKNDKVCLFGEKTSDYCAIQLGIWRLGGCVVTLLPSYPPKELEYYVQDSECQFVIATDVHKAAQCVVNYKSHHAKSNQVHVVSPKQLLFATHHHEHTLHEWEDAEHDRVNKDEDAASLIYTSGSTSQPKGVVTTHGALKAMVNGMIKSWEWTENDHILHFLPLHHVHGAVNKLLTPLSVGAKVEFVDFDSKHILERLDNPDSEKRPTVFMGVPTIYAKLIEQWEEDDRPHLKNLPNLRLFVCGSAPLPVHLFQRFQEISKQPILERYGMTEIGMALSNPLSPTSGRLPGYVGLPMPGVEVKIVDLDVDPEGGRKLEANTPGDLLVRGDSVFSTYWGKAAPFTKSEFTKDGFFKTGDVAIYDSNVNSYKIVGRKSVDIIKSGGYKISALEIERTLLECKEIDECAVLGVPDPVWGETVATIVVPRIQVGNESKVTEKYVQDFARENMANYKVPRQVLIMKSIPKNAMGKVNKKQLRSMFLKHT
jgi:malonyl-CoA/methylmalonyl-CoA synthetase